MVCRPGTATQLHSKHSQQRANGTRSVSKRANGDWRHPEFGNAFKEPPNQWCGILTLRSTMPDKLLEALRSSPLQRLPVPDSFSRLEWWSNMRDSLERTSRSCSCEKRNFSQSINRLSNEPGLSESAHQLWELGQLPGNMNHQHPHRGHLLDPLGRLRRTRQLPNIEDPWRLISLVMNFEGTAC